MSKVIELINKLKDVHSLPLDEYEYILDNFTSEDAKIAAEMALSVKKEVYGNEVFLRGLIEVSSICKNDCLYCGLRRSNKDCQRYRLTKDEILECCAEGYKIGYRTFVLQGGEDSFFNDDILCDIIKSIKGKYPDCAVTISLGERSAKSYQAIKNAGADRYLLRHETITEEHYSQLHPDNMKLEDRVQCLNELKALGFQTGCGIMVGSPFQTTKHIARDLKFIEEFKPEMCGIGPFIPHHATPFADHPAGSVELTCFLLSMVRLMHPSILLPATTALGTMHPKGREMGLLSGGNVIMPNLSPQSVRKKYELYDGKAHTGQEAAENKREIENTLKSIGMFANSSRGDFKKI